MVLRRAAELNARRWSGGSSGAPTVSAEVLVKVAAAAGLSESDVRRAMWELSAEKAAEPDNLAFKLYGSARQRVVREVSRPAPETDEYVEQILRESGGLKMRMKNGDVSLWDPGDEVGVVRRALDLSGERPLLKTRSVEVRIEDVGEERSATTLTADLSSQRAEYLSLGGILGATLAVLFVLAGVQSPLFLLGVLPALAVPVFGFKLAYMKACAEVRRALDAVVDVAERGPVREERSRDRGGLKPGQIRGLKPIPRFSPQQRDEE